MKKTTTIHLAGMVYHIEEDGFQILKKYIDDIRRVFAKQEGVDEMVADIELRIAELFQERLNEHKEVVTQTDVEHVISIMGSPNQFDDTEEYEEHQEEGKTSSNEQQSKRLYRDTDEGMLAGVIAGMGHYFNIDPVIIRVLWILLVLAGGSGILLYIIAWIAIPEAKSISEKLHMHGQSANLDNIREFTDRVKKEAKSGVQRASKSMKRTVQKSEGVIYRLFRLFARLLGFGMVVGGVIGLVFLTIAFIGDFSYIYMGGGVFTNRLSTLLDIFFTHPGWAFWLILIVTAIPLIFLSVFGAMLLSKRMRKVKFFVVALLILWIAAIVGISVIGVKTGVRFKETYKTKNKITLNQDYEALSLYLLEDGIEVSDGLDYEFNHYLSVDSDRVKLGYTRIKIAPTTDSLFYYSIEKHSMGSSLKSAKENTEKIEFIVQQKDSIFDVPVRYSFPGVSKFRNQKVFLKIYVPLGKTIVLNGNLEDYPLEIQTQSEYSDDLLAQRSVWKSTKKGMVFIEN